MIKFVVEAATASGFKKTLTVGGITDGISQIDNNLYIMLKNLPTEADKLTIKVIEVNEGEQVL